jgi:hypothetical protein
VTYQDTLVVADTTIFDLLYILRTVSDTVFVGAEEMEATKSGNSPISESQTKVKPGNGAVIRRRP